MIIQGVTLKNVGYVIDQDYISNGLQYYVDAGRTASYPGSGTSMTNISGTNIGASALANGPVFTSAGTGSYFTFNGSNNVVYTPTMLSLFNSPVNNNVTLEVWIRTSSDNGVILSEQGASPINAGWHDSQIEIVSGSVKMAVWTASGFSTIINAGAVTRNAWQQYVLTFDVSTSTLRGYINGVNTASAGSITRASPQSTGQPQLYYDLMYNDSTNEGDGSSLAGDWSIFRVYNRALSAGEVLQNFNYTKSRYGL